MVTLRDVISSGLSDNRAFVELEDADGQYVYHGIESVEDGYLDPDKTALVTLDNGEQYHIELDAEVIVSEE